MVARENHSWSEEALFAKALVYVGNMERFNTDDWEYAFWASLALEIIYRAAVAHISPTLLADKQDWHNTHYALGNATTAKKFNPKSTPSHVILDILSEVVPGFAALRDFGAELLMRRNAELHGGQLEFKDLPNSKWLPQFFETCNVLLGFMGRRLEDLFSEPKVAEEMIEGSKDVAAREVARDVAEHAELWEKRSPEEKEAASAHAKTWASRKHGHVAECPSCKNPGLLRGLKFGAVATVLDEGDVIEKQSVIPRTFECVACGLKINGPAKLMALGMGNSFTETSTTSAAEFFGLYSEDQLEEARAEYPPYDDDNNE